MSNIQINNLRLSPRSILNKQTICYQNKGYLVEENKWCPPGLNILDLEHLKNSKYNKCVQRFSLNNFSVHNLLWLIDYMATIL